MGDDDLAMTKTRADSSESPVDMGSSRGSVDASPPRDSDVLSLSQTGYAKKEFIWMPPEEKLKHFVSRAQAREDNQERAVITGVL